MKNIHVVHVFNRRYDACYKELCLLFIEFLYFCDMIAKISAGK